MFTSKNKKFNNDVTHCIKEIYETAFSSKDIKSSLTNTFSIILDYIDLEGIRVYRFDSNSNQLKNIVNYKKMNLKKNNEHDSYYDEIKIETTDNYYVITLTGCNIANNQIKNEYFTELSKVYKNIFERIEYEEKLNYFSKIDGLTHTWNRQYYKEYTIDLFKYNRCNLTYAIIDLFRLKYINDNYGHSYGDYYIILASKLISNELDSNDLLFRIGGDEFAIISKHTNKEEIENKLKNINVKMGSDMLDMELPFRLCINYGVVQGNYNLKEFYQYADELMMDHKSKTYNEYKLERRR